MTMTELQAANPEVPPATPPDDYAAVRAVVDAFMDRTTATTRQGPSGHDTATTLAVKAQLVALRLQGFTYAEIARRYGYANGSGVRQVVLRALEGALPESDRREAVMLENARYDRAAAALYPKVLQGDPRAHDSWLRNRQAAANLNGWNAPKQVTISAGVQAGMEDALNELEAVVGEVLASTPVPPDPADPGEAYDPLAEG